MTRGMRRGIAAGCLALALGLATAQEARGGDYTVRSCKEEAGAPAYPVDGWHAIGLVQVDTIGESCFRGGSLWGVLPGRDLRVGTYVGWRFDAPPGTEIVNYRISRSTTVGAGADDAKPAFFIAWPALVANNVRELCQRPDCTGLGRRDRAVPENIITPTAPMSGVQSLYFAAICGGADGKTCVKPEMRFDIHAAQITLRDSSAPALAALSGPLAEPGRTHSGTTTVTARATDAGAGVGSFTLQVDGQPVAGAPAPGCQAQPYTLRTPCPTDIAQTLELDTTTLAYGRHTATVVAVDASGNATASPPVEFRVDNRLRAAYGASLSYSYRFVKRGTRFTRLTARNVPRGSAITLSCRGRGCPFKSRRAVRSATKANHKLLTRALKRRALRPKARLTVRISAPDGSAYRRTLQIRRDKAPKRTTRCRQGEPGARYEKCG